jgi:dihydrofolate reductase
VRRIIVTEFVTVDGVIEAPENWQKYSPSEGEGEYKVNELAEAGALLMGRITYELFAGYWPTAPDARFADKMNSLPKYVVSTTLDKVEWNNSTLIRENVADEIARLKEGSGGYILVYGSADLVQTLRAHDLVDEYRLMVYPVVAGSGKRLFQNAEYLSIMELVDTKPFRPGNILLTYKSGERKNSPPVVRGRA